MRKILSIALLAVLALTNSGFTKNAFVGGLLSLPPSDGYTTQKTKHFELIYPEALKHLAPDTLKYLEEAHSVLTPIFVPEDLKPRGRTVVILVDNQDQSNGFASALGHQGLVLFTIAPEPYTGIGEYDHWLRNLIFHEYTHYLTLAPTRGVFEVLRYVFGDLILPNGLWPTWLTEGLAVYTETRFTRLGRGSGAYFRTITRDAIAKGELNNNFLRFDDIMGPVPDYPFGESNYYAGYGIVEQLVRELGDDATKNLTASGAGRVPFFLNGTLETLGGGSWRELWASYVAHEKKRLEPEIRALKDSPLPEVTSEAGASAMGARLSPDEQWLAYNFRSGHELSSLRVRNLKTGEVKSLARNVVSPWMSWSKDSQWLYFSKIDYNGPFWVQGDLHRWSPKHGMERLTDGERVKDVTVCGNDVVFSSMRSGYSYLKRLPVAETSRKSETLYRAPLHHRVATPNCHDATVYFSEHGTAPRESIYALDLESRKVRHVLGGPKATFGATFPEPTAEGLLFTRVSNGYYELALLARGATQARVVARNTGGYWMPSRTANKLAVTYLSSDGFQTAFLDPAILKASLSESPRTGGDELSQGKEPSPASVQAEEPSGYFFGKSLLPRLWSPYLLIGSKRNEYGALITGWDDLDIVNYSLTAYYDTLKDGPLGDAVISTRLSGGFRFAVGASAGLTSFSTSGAGDAYNEEWVIGARLSRPFPALFSTWEPFITGEWARVHFDGDFGTVYFQPEWRYGLGLNFEGRQRYAYSIAAETGSSARFEVKRFQRTNRFREGAIKYLVSYTHLFPLWPEHSSLSVTGTVAGTPNPKSFLPVSFVEIGGRGRPADLDPAFRGYPVGAIRGRTAFISQLEYRFPIAQGFNGNDTFPFFFKNMGGAVFGDLAKVESVSGSFRPLVAGVGAAMIFNSNIGYLLPLNLRLEFARGLSKSRGGENQVVLGLEL